jgi:hypothetical protein
VPDYPEHVPEDRIGGVISELIGRPTPISPRTMSLWRQRGMGPPYTKVGRTISYNVDATRQWLLDQQQTPTPQRTQQQQAPPQRAQPPTPQRAQPRLRPLPTRKPATAQSTTPSSTKASS